MNSESSSDEVIPQAKQKAANNEVGQNNPTVPSREESTRQTCPSQNTHYPWKERLELSLKFLEALAFIAIIMTFYEMRQTRMGDERAWVMTSQNTMANFDIDPNTRTRVGVSFDVGIKNTGRTPAINVVPHIGIFINTNQIHVIDDYPNPVYHSFLLPPNVEQTIPIEHLLPDAAAYDFITNGGAVYLAGTIWYDDIFGKHHWTKFCLVPNSDCSAYSMANFYNSCDEAQTSNQNDFEELPFASKLAVGAFYGIIIAGILWMFLGWIIYQRPCQ